MKNKKIISLFVVILVCISLVACKRDDTVVDSNDPSNIENEHQLVVNSGENETENDISGDVILNFESQFTEGVKDFIPALRAMDNYLKAGPEANYRDYGVSSLLNSINRSDDYFSKMSFLLKDLNNDGVEEFLLYYDSEELKNVIISMSTLVSGDCYCILNSQEDMRFSLYENDIIKTELLDEEYSDFSKLDENFKLNVLDSIQKNTPEEEVQTILAKYKEAELELKKLK